MRGYDRENVNACHRVHSNAHFCRDYRHHDRMRSERHLFPCRRLGRRKRANRRRQCAKNPLDRKPIVNRHRSRRRTGGHENYRHAVQYDWRADAGWNSRLLERHDWHVGFRHANDDERRRDGQPDIFENRQRMQHGHSHFRLVGKLNFGLRHARGRDGYADNYADAFEIVHHQRG